MKAAAKTSIHWIVANLIGMFVYLLFERLALAPRSEPNMEPASSQVLNLMVLLCFFVSLFVFNLIWLISVIKRLHSDRTGQPLVIWLAVNVLWGITLALPIFGYSFAIGILKILIGMIDGSAWK
jgi:hypothetical protein